MFNNIANGTLLIIAGIFMILSGLSLLGRLNFLNRIEHSMHNLLGIERYLERLSR